MIIVRLVGGLGNQMFQYALGRHLSVIHNRELKLDISGYMGNIANPLKGIRVFSLQAFNIQQNFASSEDLKPFLWAKKTNFSYKILRRLNCLGNYARKSYLVEPEKNYFKFDERLLKSEIKNPVYIQGFWQSEKYFKNIEKIIRDDFSFKQEPSGLNAIMYGRINQTESVCIHVRHGDNATSAAEQHGVLPMEYYNKAVEILTQKVKNPEFYIFSDDPDWARKNLRLDYPTQYISHNGDSKNYEDLRLMIACRHHIIGNSTFSWWAAWLGKKPNQMVFAPQKYHMHGSTKIIDLYPETWQIL